MYPKVLYLLPTAGGTGGANSVVQETLGLRKLNVDALIANKVKFKESFLKLYPEADGACLFYRHDQQLIRMAASFDIIVATGYKTVSVLENIMKQIPNVTPSYYIQDYEPYFYRKYTRGYNRAKQSYEKIPSIKAFAKTNWIIETVQKHHQISVAKVKPSLDNTIFYPKSDADDPSTKHVKITAMIRPSTPWRSPAETLGVLAQVKERYKDNIEICLFGCDTSQLEGLADFNYTFFGKLSRKEVAELLRSSDIFIDLSRYQAFGRTGLEAMACGCSTILPNLGGVNDYAVHEKNSLLINVKEHESVMDSIERVIEDTEFRNTMKEAGIETARKYSVEEACLSIKYFFHQALLLTR